MKYIKITLALVLYTLINYFVLNYTKFYNFNYVIFELGGKETNMVIPIFVYLLEILLLVLLIYKKLIFKIICLIVLLLMAYPTIPHNFGAQNNSSFFSEVKRQNSEKNKGFQSALWQDRIVTKRSDSHNAIL